MLIDYKDLLERIKLLEAITKNQGNISNAVVRDMTSFEQRIQSLEDHRKLQTEAIRNLSNRLLDVEYMNDAVRGMESATEYCTKEISLLSNLNNAAHSGLASRIDGIVKYCNANFETIQGFIDDYRKSEAEQEDKEPACPTCGGHHG